MAWTYDETQLDVPLNWIRYKLSDTVSTTYSPSDELVGYWLTFFDGDKYKAAAELARHLSRTYGKLATTSSSDGTVKIGGMSLEGPSASTYLQAKDFYADLAKELEGHDGSEGAHAITPSYAETCSIFSIGMMDNGWVNTDPTDIVR
jgi:hypothetical protein